MAAPLEFLEFRPETAHVSIYTAFLRHLGTLPVFPLKAKTGGFPSRQGSGWFCGVGRAVGDFSRIKRYRRSRPSRKDVAPSLDTRYPGRHFSVWRRGR